MEGWRDGPLGIGVIGLGRLWESRHRPALARPGGRFRVAAVFDQVARRANVEAARLRCVASVGLAQLVERPDVHAVYLLDPQWFGLHPALLARRLGKPVYCAPPLAADPPALAELAADRSESPPFTPELARRLYPSTLRLRELLATTLGPVRSIEGFSRVADFDRNAEPGPATQLAHLPLTIDPGASLLDWCRWVIGAEPVALTAESGTAESVDAPAAGRDSAGFLAEFPGGATARISYRRPVRDESAQLSIRPGFRVIAEEGSAFVEPPDRVHWIDAAGLSHDEHLTAGPGLGEALNDQFLRHLQGEPSLAPTLADALAVARLARALEQGRREGRRVSLEG